MELPDQSAETQNSNSSNRRFCGLTAKEGLSLVSSLVLTTYIRYFYGCSYSLSTNSF